jgi:effector-binding domain-containing protein
MEHEVRLAERPSLLVMSKRVSVRVPEIGGVLGAALGEVYGYLGARGVAPAGPPFVIYHGMPEEDRPFDMEMCAPIGRAVDPPAGWQAQELPAGTFASLLHVGPYDGVGAAYDALGSWIGSNGMIVAGPPREVYLSEPDTPPGQIRTIVEFPVTARAAPAVAG